MCFLKDVGLAIASRDVRQDQLVDVGLPSQSGCLRRGQMIELLRQIGVALQISGLDDQHVGSTYRLHQIRGLPRVADMCQPGASLRRAKHLVRMDHASIRQFHALTGDQSTSLRTLRNTEGLRAPGKAAPSERIGVAVLGVGSRGTAHTRALLGRSDAQLLAMCDANKPKADKLAKQADARYGDQAGEAGWKGCGSTSDFREVLARADVDAVFIAAPENWHAVMASLAVQAGKDVYCEKALSLTVAEGRHLCRTVRRYGKVLQVGTQQRSDGRFRHACELAINGYLGKLRRVEVGRASCRERV